MPRIEAATVAEHRDLRQQALLDAATEIARTEGVTAVTVGAVADRAGIARSTVYGYFASSADLIADVLVDELTAMAALLDERVGAAETFDEAISTWIRESLAYVIDGRHAFVRSAASLDLPPTRKAQLNALHRRMAAPLVAVFAAAGHSDAARCAQQVAAIVDVCVRRIEAGASVEEEIAAAERFVAAGCATSR